MEKDTYIQREKLYNYFIKKTSNKNKYWVLCKKKWHNYINSMCGNGIDIMFCPKIKRKLMLRQIVHYLGFSCSRWFWYSVRVLGENQAV